MRRANKLFSPFLRVVRKSSRERTLFLYHASERNPVPVLRVARIIIVKNELLWDGMAASSLNPCGLLDNLEVLFYHTLR